MSYDGYSASDLAAELGVPACYVLRRVTSTLDVIHELAAGGAPTGTLVLADEQVMGRGRRGRAWHSPPGSGIWLGYLFRGDPSLQSLRAGILLAQSLNGLGFEARLKWPNDILIGSRKTAGILCEGRSGWLALGIGINVHGPVPPELRERAVSLDEFEAVERMSVLRKLVPGLGSLAAAPALGDEELAALAELDWLRGKEIREPLRGVADGIAADGALLVATGEGGARKIYGGGVVTA